MIWSQLPNQIPIHFNIADQADNFQPKPLVVFGLPILLLLVHLFVIFMIGRDPKNRMMNEKMVKVNHWLTPIVSLSISYLIYSKALGSTTNPSVLIFINFNSITKLFCKVKLLDKKIEIFERNFSVVCSSKVLAYLCGLFYAIMVKNETRGMT